MHHPSQSENNTTLSAARFQRCLCREARAAGNALPCWRLVIRCGHRKARSKIVSARLDVWEFEMTTERCLHFGPDCQGSMQTEHITYSPDTTAPICTFHNQVLRVMRLSLALSKTAASLKGKLTVKQRIHTVAVLKLHRFDPSSVRKTDAYCKKLAADKGIGLGKLDYKKHRTTPTRTDPVDGIPFRISFKPETKRGLVTCCKWDVWLV